MVCILTVQRRHQIEGPDRVKILRSHGAAASDLVVAAR
jgi:hypothetical protein